MTGGVLRLRRRLQVLVAVGAAGACLDLLLLGHVEGWQQIIPFTALALVLVSLAWLRLAPGTVASRGARAAMLLTMTVGAVGVGLHARGSMEFQRESDPSTGGLPLVRKVMLAHSPPAPRLPPPTGAVVHVRTESQLQTAVSNLRSGTTIVIAPGRYRLTSTLSFRGGLVDVGLRGATGNAEDVVLIGPGMTQTAYGDVPFGIWTGTGVDRITIANLTVRDLYFHSIVFNAGTQRPHVYNVHLIDAGEQFIKSNPDTEGGGVNGGVVEYSILEYSTVARDAYTNGIDVHAGANWIIRHNLFRNLVAPNDELAGPAILMWNRSRNTLTEGNTFINCARGISYGLVERPGHDHAGGMIRNNIIYRSVAHRGDVGIHVADSPGTRVLHNTVILSGTYPFSIEYRYAGASGVVVASNLHDGRILARDGASGSEQYNVGSAIPAMFVDVAGGDLHLIRSATTAIDQAPPLDDVPLDWDGQPRPNGPGSDVGADEFDVKWDRDSR